MESKFDYKYLSPIYDACKSLFWDNYSKQLKSVFLKIPKSVLDLGCGSGLAINHLNCKPDSYLGVDISQSMLEVAKAKYPIFDFRHKSILTFSEPREFDLVLSAFDTINHLLRIEDWGLAFHTARRHLSSEGYFVFDVVTPFDHEFNWPGQVNVTESDNWLYIQRSEFDKGNGMASITNTIFHRFDLTWTRFDEEIKQISLPVNIILELLNNARLECFKIIDLQSGDPPIDSSATLLFFCKSIN